MTSPSLRTPGWISSAFSLSCILSILHLCRPQVAKAEDSVSYKYQWWQEDSGRIGVKSSYASFNKDLGPDMNLSVMALIDSISGATPTGEIARTKGGPTPTVQMKDQRRALDLEFSRQWGVFSATGGYAYSRESDYISRGLTLNTVTDFNQKNTELLLGDNNTDDTIMEPKLGWLKNRKKNGNDFLAGVKQVVNATTTVQGNVTIGHSTGYEADPYKIVSTTMLNLDPGTYYTVPENRPRFRNSVSLFAGLNHSFESVHGAVDLSYRHYHDTFGVSSNTVSVAWIQDLTDHLTVQPFLRYYVQTAASFYYYNLDQAHVVTSYDTSTFETGTGQAPFYSSDPRLSHMQSLDPGLKLTWKVNPRLSFDVSFDRYESRGLDSVTPQDAYYKANNVILGAKYAF